MATLAVIDLSIARAYVLTAFTATVRFREIERASAAAVAADVPKTFENARAMVAAAAVDAKTVLTVLRIIAAEPVVAALMVRTKAP